ncbi:flagellar hook-associated protein FlgK [Leifsonia sp. YAF41]|uniref:flagellar hook-associated protein FlgK n=1 Tax=Leifsonia sp. YAF41 TaxID=3233086 RepID=UPI003F9DB79C
MSTFSGLNTAYSGLVASRTGIEVTGQNIANAKTAGYTRQRVTQDAMNPLAATGRISTRLAAAGQGVTVTGIDRIGDVFLDARVRTTFGSSGYANVRANSLSNLEKSLNEPGTNGISAQLGDFWSSWQDLANNASKAAAGAVVIEEANVLVSQIAAGYNAVATEWNAVRGSADAQTKELNFAANQVAELNVIIRDTLSRGGSVNELLDQRSQYTTAIASLAGGTVNERPDGTVDVVIGGNVLVSGDTANAVVFGGSSSIEGTGVTLEWADHPGRPVALSSGELAGSLSVLAPAVAGGKGGPLAEAAAEYNNLATKLAAQVNSVHSTGYNAAGVTGLNFFTFTPGTSAALGLKVVPTQGDEIALSGVNGPSVDGSNADKIAQLRLGSGSPDAIWSTFVTTVAVSTKNSLQQSKLADLAASAASSAQLSNASVDIDEENVNLVMNQTAYQASARVFTAVDEMLDTLINRTGLVGR